MFFFTNFFRTDGVCSSLCEPRLSPRFIFLNCAVTPNCEKLPHNRQCMFSTLKIDFLFTTKFFTIYIIVLLMIIIRLQEDLANL